MKKTKIFDYVCIAVMLGVVVVQFLPFWFYEGQSTSTQMYIWFPDKCKTLTKLLKEILGKDYNINHVVLGPAALLIAPVVACVLYVIKPKNYFIRILPVVAAVIGLWMYLSHPVFALGSYYAIHLISIVIYIV